MWALATSDGRRLARHDLPGAAGLALDAAGGRLWASGEAANRLESLDLAELAPAAPPLALPEADTLALDAATRTLFVGYGDGAVQALDLTTGQSTATWTLAGHPEALVVDPDGRRVYANVPDRAEVTVLDRQTGTVAAHWALTGARYNYPLALDAAHHRLFVGCRWPATVVVLDTTDGHRVATVPIALDVDDLWYDAQTARVLASCGAGRLCVVQATAPADYRPLGAVATRLGARTSLFVPAQRRLYLAVPSRLGQSAAVWVYDVE